MKHWDQFAPNFCVNLKEFSILGRFSIANSQQLINCCQKSIKNHQFLATIGKLLSKCCQRIFDQKTETWFVLMTGVFRRTVAQLHSWTTRGPFTMPPAKVKQKPNVRPGEAILNQVFLCSPACITKWFLFSGRYWTAVSVSPYEHEIGTN